MSCILGYTGITSVRSWKKSREKNGSNDCNWRKQFLSRFALINRSNVSTISIYVLVHVLGCFHWITPALQIHQQNATSQIHSLIIWPDISYYTLSCWKNLLYLKPHPCKHQRVLARNQGESQCTCQTEPVDLLRVHLLPVSDACLLKSPVLLLGVIHLPPPKHPQIYCPQ